MLRKGLLFGFFVVFAFGFSQNLLSYDWDLVFNSDTDLYQKKGVNLLLSWERQALSYLSPHGVLIHGFEIPEGADSVDYVLDVNLLASVHEVIINGHYIGGDFSTDFVWSASPTYQSHKFKVQKEYLSSSRSNTIMISCSNFSYTGGISHNLVELRSENSVEESSIDLLFKSPQHLYQSSEDVAINLRTQSPCRGQVKLILRNDYSDTIFVKELQLKKGIHVETFSMKELGLPPGFYEMIALMSNKGHVGTVGWFAVSPGRIAKSSSAPLGFQNYWEEAKAELHAVVPDYKVTKVDSLCTHNRDGYIVEMKSVGGVTVRGYYFVPKLKKKYPAIINFPGYGYGFEYLDEFLAVEEDVIELAFCVRGHGISKAAMSDVLPIPGFVGYNICNVDSAAYRMIYMDCLRAVDFLLSREEVDADKIGVLGASQGGGLSLMTAGLASRNVSACAYYDPFPTDLNNHLKIRTLLNEEIAGFLEYYNNLCSCNTALSTLDFMDTKYFADKILCPTLYITGLMDDDCPPRLGFSAYNEIRSPKRFKIFPNDSHIGESGWKKEAMSFFKDKFRF